MSISDAPAEQTVEAMDGTHGAKILIAALAAVWQGFIKSMPERYKPERHYMRGPGPAYARKYLQHRQA